MAEQGALPSSDDELERVLKMNAYLGCRGTHRDSQGNLLPCASRESLARVSNRAEPDAKTRKKRRRRAPGFERLAGRGVLGIDTLPGGGLVSSPVAVKRDDLVLELKEKRRRARSDRLAATPAKPSERISGSSRNASGTASSSSSGSSIDLSDNVENSLKEKVRSHNEKMRSANKPAHSMASLRSLKAVYRRGAGAFSASHRPGMSRGQWAMARVNAYLFLLEKGRPRNVRYTTDNDLLPSGHPKSSKSAFIDLDEKNAFRRFGRGVRRFVPFIRNARDRDKDKIVQEGTIHERPAGPDTPEPVKPTRQSARQERLATRASAKPRKASNERLTKPFGKKRPTSSEQSGDKKPEIRQQRISEVSSQDSLPDVSSRAPQNGDNSDIKDSLPEHLQNADDVYRGGKYPGPPLTPEVVESFREGSAQKHLVDDGQGGLKFSPEREALHDRIVEAILAGRPSSANPIVVMMGGGPASGKSSVSRRDDFEASEATSVLIDADKIKSMLPEMDEMIAEGQSPTSSANFVHQESRYVLQRVHGQAMANQQDVILDGTGNHNVAYNQSRVDQARKAGYRVTANYVSIDSETAFVRSKIREILENRGVPPRAILDQHAKVSGVFEDVLEMFDNLMLWDNNSSSPVLIGRTGADGKFEILDQKGYDRFISKRDEVFDQQAYDELIEKNKDFIDETVTAIRAKEEAARQAKEEALRAQGKTLFYLLNGFKVSYK